MFGNLVIHEGKGAQSKRLKREFGFKKFWMPVSISFLLPSESAAGNLYEISLDRKGKLRPIFLSLFYIVNFCVLFVRQTLGQSRNWLKTSIFLCKIFPKKLCFNKFVCFQKMRLFFFLRLPEKEKTFFSVSIWFFPPSGSAAGNLYELSLDRKGKLRPIFFGAFSIL